MRALFAVPALALLFCGLLTAAQQARADEARPHLAMDGTTADDGSPTLKPKPQPRLAAPPANTPDAKSPDGKAASAKPAEPDRAKRLDALFEALKVAPTKESAKAIADRIDVALLPSDSDTADLLMSRAALAAEAKDFDLAIKLLDGVIAVAPDHLEAWNKRATVFFLKQDFSDSLADLQQVLAREPRHYGAWAGIALICKEIGDEKHALDAARRALAIYPQLDQMKEMEKSLAISVEGRPI